MGNVMELSEEEREEALKKYEKIRGYFERGVSQSELAREQKVPIRTLCSWVKRYREGGLIGLARQKRRDQGKTRGVCEELRGLIEGLYLGKPQPQMTSIHRKVSEVAKERGWREPSYSQVYEIVKQLKPGLVTMGQEGGEAYREKYDLLYRWEASHPNEVWQADHYQLPVFVLNERGTAGKPMLSIVLDDYSRAIAGYRLSWSGASALQTALTLRGAIRSKGDARWSVQGIPESLYTDHGSDFTSKALSALAAELQMELIFSRKGRPQGRGKIERFFRTVEQEFLCDLPGYAPKGDWRQRRESDEQSRPAARLSMEELEALFRKWLLDGYHVRIQEGIGEAPLDRWKAGKVVPVMPKSLEELDVLLLTFPARRRVQQDGISFQGQKYFDLALAEYVGEEVVVRYDPADLSGIAVYVPDERLEQDHRYLRERFVCRAESRELIGDQITLKQVVSKRETRRKELSQELREKREKVKKYASDDIESERWRGAAERALPDVSEESVSVVSVKEECVEQEPRIKRFAHE